MRLGGPVFIESKDPAAWAAAHRRLGYSAAYCPVDSKAGDDVVQAYARAAKEADIVIAEVGAWSNPMHPDEAKRRQALTYCQEQLALADRIGARCCVNIAGACGEVWDGPYPENLAPATFDAVVESVRAIIDAVRPTRSDYTLETMPWMLPYSAESYERLIRAVDRPRFAVHLDPVNLVSSLQLYFGSGDLLRECFARLGPYIRSCHAKDVHLTTQLTLHLDEVVPGRGGLDYRAYLECLSRLDPDTPLMLEHMSKPEEYDEGARYVRSVAEDLGLSFK